MTEASGADAWELTEITQTRGEFYFIGHRLDQNRSVQTHETEVKLYKKSEDGQYLGSAKDVISPTATEDEIKDILSRLLFQAGLVKNPDYTLTDARLDFADILTDSKNTEQKDQKDCVVSTTAEWNSAEQNTGNTTAEWNTESTTTERNTGSLTAKNCTVSDIAKECILALSSVPETAGEKINSYEIFVSEITKYFLNSNGVEYTCTYPSTELEVVVNAKNGQKEIELHRIYQSGTCDRARLTADITQVMQYGRDRLNAQPTPNLQKADVLFSTEAATAIYEYFADRMHADYVVRKISDWKIGQAVAPDEGGDKLSLQAVPFLPNSSMNYPADSEGNQIREQFLIRDGIAEAFCGSRQFSCYLGLDQSFQLTNRIVSGGQKTEEELRKNDYLEIVEFSDFQVDSMSGEIAGEIRLGYLHRGDTVQIVTGGSVSGSMAEAAGSMEFSRETVQYNNQVIPRVTLLKGLRIAGHL